MGTKAPSNWLNKKLAIVCSTSRGFKSTQSTAQINVDRNRGHYDHVKFKWNWIHNAIQCGPGRNKSKFNSIQFTAIHNSVRCEPDQISIRAGQCSTQFIPHFNSVWTRARVNPIQFSNQVNVEVKVQLNSFQFNPQFSLLLTWPKVSWDDYKQWVSSQTLRCAGARSGTKKKKRADKGHCPRMKGPATQRFVWPAACIKTPGLLRLRHLMRLFLYINKSRSNGAPLENMDNTGKIYC